MPCSRGPAESPADSKEDVAQHTTFASTGSVTGTQHVALGWMTRCCDVRTTALTPLRRPLVWRVPPHDPMTAYPFGNKMSNCSGSKQSVGDGLIKRWRTQRIVVRLEPLVIVCLRLLVRLRLQGVESVVAVIVRCVLDEGCWYCCGTADRDPRKLPI